MPCLAPLHARQSEPITEFLWDWEIFSARRWDNGRVELVVCTVLA